jgi:hypothetical protein
MLLAPLNKQMTTLKRITEYGSLVALDALLTAHFIPSLQTLQQSYTLGMSVSSILVCLGLEEAPNRVDGNKANWSITI